MPRFFRITLLSLSGMVLTGVAGAWAQQTQSKPASAAGAPGAVRAPAIPGANDVVATIVDGNQTEKVTKGDVITFLSRNPIPDDEDRESLYMQTVERLINTKLLMMFLARQPMPVTPEKIDEQIEQLKQDLKKDGQDLGTALLQNNISLDDIRKEYENRIRWQEHVKTKGTEATLRKYLSEHRDLFGGTLIRASHILLRVEPIAPQAEKEKAKQKLLQIKQDIADGKTTFALAANKFSQDTANSGGAGGDLDYFSLTTGFPEEFTNVAFKLKKGLISDPVETPYGFHLILLTDRKEGKPVDFEQNKIYIMNEFGNELQKNVVNAQRQRAKIEIKPMPKDLFPSQAPAAPVGGAGAVEAPKAAGGTAVPKS
jgi:peptidyl-prolyl cis-trans isomerase C